MEVIKKKLNYQEDYSRRNNIRIDGLEEDPSENWEIIQDKVQRLAREKLDSRLATALPAPAPAAGISAPSASAVVTLGEYLTAAGGSGVGAVGGHGLEREERPRRAAAKKKGGGNSGNNNYKNYRIRNRQQQSRQRATRTRQQQEGYYHPPTAQYRSSLSSHHPAGQNSSIHIRPAKQHRPPAPPRRRGEETVCSYCSRRGHTIKDCKTRAAEQRQEHLLRRVIAEVRQPTPSFPSPPPGFSNIVPQPPLWGQTPGWQWAPNLPYLNNHANQQQQLR
ncbi:hypothetical protein Pmani_006790 [Petrolisthes manimaculis]|uniref:CCHC-type domain-containing protein n=1 Tax=Petrolisthes manimaculis TaxID=1843537 RepID=A0AAE1QA85_9EUCA|nr:hypothetical protein Pmani_006790 [Petrolisthes manimaculis]